MVHKPTVLSIKWGTAFSALDVNLLYRACRANTSSKLRFVCLTDDGRGLDPDIEIRDIPDIGLTPEDWKRPGVWRKLSLYAPELHDLGRVLFIDLDMMIFGSLDPFFGMQHGVFFLNTGDSWCKNPMSNHTEGGTAIFSFDPSTEGGVLEAFQTNPAVHMDNFHNEQDFVFAHVTCTKFWPEGQVISFKRHLCRRYGIGLAQPIHPVPEGTSVIAFHGNPRPRDVKDNFLWGRFPHIHAGTPVELKTYWQKYSAEG